MARPLVVDSHGRTQIPFLRGILTRSLQDAGVPFDDASGNRLRAWLGVPREVFYDPRTLARVTSVVREVSPEILLTHAPSDYMEDHMITCRLAVTAAFTRGMPNFPVDPPHDPVTNKVTIYHAQPFSHRDPLRQLVTPDMFVNVSEVVERKVEMLSKHVSQKKWLDESQGHDSYLQTLRDLDAECGRMSGMFEFAEGWRRHLHLGFCDEQDDPLREALHDRMLMAN